MYNACIVLTDEHIHVGYYTLAACVSYDIPTKNQSVSVLPIIHTSVLTNTKVQFTYLSIMTKSLSGLLTFTFNRFMSLRT